MSWTFHIALEVCRRLLGRVTILLPLVLASCSDDSGTDASDGGGGDASCSSCKGSCNQGHCLTVLASPVTPSDMALSDGSLYWTALGARGGMGQCPFGDAGCNDGWVGTVGVNGGHVRNVAVGQNSPSWVTVVRGNVYWVDYDVVMSSSGTGTTILSWTDTQALPQVASDAERLYWATASGTVMSLRIAGGHPSTLVTNGTSDARPTGGIAVYGSTVYWTSPTSVMKVSRDGGKSSVVMGGLDNPNTLVVGNGSLYWASSNSLASMRVEGGDGPVVTFASGINPMSLAVDEGAAYFGTADNRVCKVPLAGGAVETLAVEQLGVISIAVDSMAVYFIGYSGVGIGGSIARIAPK